MPVDETHLRELAKSLASEYRALHAMKHDTTQPEARVMKARPGPSNPGNWLIISCYIDNEQRLREVALNAFHDTGIKIKDTDFTAPRICDIIAYNAQAISELNWANDLIDEMAQQERAISRRTNQQATMQHKIATTEKWGTAKQLATIINQATGKNIDSRTITSIGRANDITKRADHYGINQYNLQEIYKKLHDVYPK